MKSTLYFATMLFLRFSTSALAFPEQPSPAIPSPGLQIARRVAAIENDKDLPSRAVWLSKKAALNTHLAYEAQATQKPKKRHTN